MTLTLAALLWLTALAPAGAQDLGMGVDLSGKAAIDFGLDLAAATLANGLTHSRDQARAAGTLPMPPRIRAALLDWYPADLLDSVEYRVGATRAMTIQSSSIQYGGAIAVTTLDTITFVDAWDAGNNIALWGHEMKHVEQFRAWGVYGFARAYVRDHLAVEHQAEAVETALKALHGGG